MMGRQFLVDWLGQSQSGYTAISHLFGRLESLDPRDSRRQHAVRNRCCRHRAELAQVLLPIMSDSSAAHRGVYPDTHQEREVGIATLILGVIADLVPSLSSRSRCRHGSYI